MSTRTIFATRTNSFFRGKLADVIIQVKNRTVQFKLNSINYDEPVQLTEDDNCPGPKKTGKIVIGTSVSPVSGKSIVNTESV